MTSTACSILRGPHRPMRLRPELRRAWWRGYEDAFNGQRAESQEPWYASGYAEGAGAAARRDQIRSLKNRRESIRDAAPNHVRLLEVLGVETMETTT